MCHGQVAIVFLPPGSISGDGLARSVVVVYDSVAGLGQLAGWAVSLVAQRRKTSQATASNVEQRHRYKRASTGATGRANGSRATGGPQGATGSPPFVSPHLDPRPLAASQQDTGDWLQGLGAFLVRREKPVPQPAGTSLHLQAVQRYFTGGYLPT